jgi:hypothetical protein
MIEHFKNFKTTIPAILAVGVCVAYGMNYLTTEQFSLITTLLISAGLIAAKDSGK